MTPFLTSLAAGLTAAGSYLSLNGRPILGVIAGGLGTLIAYLVKQPKFWGRQLPPPATLPPVKPKAQP
jgi:hypothetical protein